MGCQLGWNPEELTWDCPCHGSRFDYSGNLVSGPATMDLNKPGFDTDENGTDNNSPGVAKE